MVGLSPTRLYKGSEIPFHAVGGSMKIVQAVDVTGVHAKILHGAHRTGGIG